MAQITIQNLSFNIGDKVILDSINLQISPGEFFFLLGPSGSGKTTLLRVLAGFNQPSAGFLYLDGNKINNIPPRKRNIGMVFQSYALFPHLTISENIEYGLKVREIPKNERLDQIQYVLNLVGLSGYEKRFPNSLSGGEQQRVALARALVIKPQLLLLDEPLSNLDAQLRIRMRKEIRDIQKKSGITAVYVTHDQDEALSMADRMAVMTDGKILQTGTPKDIYYQPVNSVVANFIGKANLIRGTIRIDHSISCLDTSWGKIQLSKINQDYSNGEIVHICIRPESIEILEPEETQPGDSFPAIIRDLGFFGESLELYLLLSNNDILHVILSNPRHWNYQINQDIRFYIPPDEIILLEK